LVARGYDFADGRKVAIGIKMNFCFSYISAVGDTISNPHQGTASATLDFTWYALLQTHPVKIWKEPGRAITLVSCGKD